MPTNNPIDTIQANPTEPASAHTTATHDVQPLTHRLSQTPVSQSEDSQAMPSHQERVTLSANEPGKQTDSPEPCPPETRDALAAKHRANLAEFYALVDEQSPLLLGFRFVPPCSPKLKAIEAQIIRAETQTIDQLGGLS